MIKAIVPSAHDYVLYGRPADLSAAAALLRESAAAQQVGIVPKSGALILRTPRPLNNDEMALTRAVAA